MLQIWQESFRVAAQGQGTLFNTYTTAKTILPAGCLVDVERNFWVPGRMVRLTAVAGISNRITGPDTFTLQLMQGTNVLFSSGAINLTTTAHAVIPALITGLFTCQVAGAAAQIRGLFEVTGQMVAMASGLADGAANTGYAMGPNTASALGTAFDGTASGTLDFWVAQSFSGAGNGIQINQYLLESLN